MNKTTIKKTSIFLKHEDPINEALENKRCSNNYVTTTMGPTLKSLSKDKGYGRLMIHIHNNPGLTKKKILENLQISCQCNEMFQCMSHMKLIYNIRRKGYFITELGTAVLYKFDLI